MPSPGGEEEHPRQHRSRWIRSAHADWVVLMPLSPGGDMKGGMMHGDGGVKEGEIGARGEVSYSMQT
jgi:hypothetical protein